MDEFSQLSAKESAKLKNMLTAEKTRFEKKCKDSIVVDNFVNMVFTSNEEDTLQVTSDDRRLVLFKCSRIYKGNTDYFDTLSAHLSRPEVARGFLQHLKTRNLSAYPHHFQARRPITAYYIAMQRANIPSFSGFLSAMINDENFPKKILSRDFFNGYRDFHASQNYKSAGLFTPSAFGIGLNELPEGSFEKKRTAGGYTYENFNIALIEEHLISKNELDRFITLK